jgi:uncharacterized membrane protein
MPPSRQHGWSDERIEQIVGNLLRTGVLTAAAVVALGAILYLIQEGSGQPAYQQFQGEPPSLRHVTDIAADALNWKGRAIIQLGLVLLLATPIARVALSAVMFALQRDRLYVVVSVIVLAILLGSIAGLRL